MKWILGYAVGAALLLTPIGLRVALRSEAASAALDLAAVSEGMVLFTHEWTANDPLCPTGDGLGPVFNATSCAQCHSQGGVGGSGGNDHNVTMFVNHSLRGKAVRFLIMRLTPTKQASRSPPAP